MIKRVYKTKIELPDEKVYGEALRFLGEVSFGSECIVGKTKYYFLDKNQEGIVRVDLKNKTIELTDTVEQDIIDSIKNISKQLRVDKILK